MSCEVQASPAGRMPCARLCGVSIAACLWHCCSPCSKSSIDPSSIHVHDADAHRRGVSLLLGAIGLWCVVVRGHAAHARNRRAPRPRRAACAAHAIGREQRRPARRHRPGPWPRRAAGLTRYLGTLLFETEPLDPATFAATTVALFVIALMASYLPARRAAAVSPLESMRAD